MTGGLEQLGCNQYDDQQPSQMTGGLGRLRFDRGTQQLPWLDCNDRGTWQMAEYQLDDRGTWQLAQFTFVTGGPGKWLVNILMTGGLDQTSFDRGTLTFLMGRLQFLMKFTESRNPISNWLQNEHTNKTLSVLQGALMPFNHPIS